LLGGKYHISRFLAEGGMGVVYEAQHAIVKRRFAVKFLRPDSVRRRETLARFQREAETAGSLESEHIASVVDFGIANDGSPYIVMEYLVGESLASLLGREGRLPVQRATDLCIQACHGAETAHAAGIVHRDLKPHSLFMCRRDDGTDLLKIFDFGIAKLQLAKHDQLSTQTGTVMGTPAYMSPEQARGERTVDARADVYSLGAILFEMLSGELPHPGESRNAVLYHISTQPTVSLGAVSPGLPQPLVETVDRALASSPGARPASAKAFAAELARFAKREAWPELRSRTTASFPADSPGSTENLITPQPPTPAGESPVRTLVADRPMRRPTWMHVAAVAMVVAVLAAAGVVSRRWSKAVPQPSDLPSATTKEPAPPTVQAVPRPTETVSPPAPPPSTSLATSPRLLEAAHAPAKTVLPKQPGAAGRPDGRPIRRPAENASEPGPDSHGPLAPPKAANPAFPQGIIDRHDPY
jgi:serine/threonine-protein kinase